MRTMAGFIAIKMAFASGTPHHQHPRSHEPRPHAANGIDERAESGAHPDQQILVEQKEGLCATNLTNRVLDDEITVIELGVERILDQFVVSMILALVRECALPARVLLQTITCDDFKMTLHRLDPDQMCRASDVPSFSDCLCVDRGC